MSNKQDHVSTTSTTTQIIRNKYEKLKTLVLKLKPSYCHQDLSSLNSDQLDAFVDEMIDDLQNSLVSNMNDLRERLKQAQPHPDDPQYANKMIAYQELLEQMVPIIHKLKNVIGQILDELHKLIEQLWKDISQNNGNTVAHILEKHARQTETLMNELWIKHIDELEVKLHALPDVDNMETRF